MGILSSSIEAPPRPLSRRTITFLLLIIAAGVLVRLHRIHDPMIGYRQCDTAAIARNFYENGMHLLSPQIDWRGNSSGYVESEFPLYTYFIAVLYRIFGVHEAIGRCVSIVIYVFSALLLFQLCRRMFDDSVALLAAFFYTIATLAYFLTRTFQPDALLALGSIAGVYYFWIWMEEGGIRAFLLSAVGICTAALIKPTNFYLGLPLAYLAWRSFGWRFLRRPELWLYAIAVILPPVLWFRHAYGLWLTAGNTFGVFGGWVKYRVFPPDVSMAVSAAKQILFRMMILVATPVGLVLLLVGFFTRPPGRIYLLHWWAAGFSVCAVIAAKGMEVHDYYQLPAVFLAAAWMGYGVAWLWNWARVPSRVMRPVLIAVCVFILAFSVWRWGLRIQIPSKEWDRVAFAARVQALTEPSALIIMVRPYRGLPGLYQHRTAQGEYLECDPVDFYRSHRVGWSLDDRQATSAFIETLRTRGARYFATAFPEIFQKYPELKADLDRDYTPLEVTPAWAIYRLDQAASRRANSAASKE
jgi:4-amino-4-deoxy-L-arabinose transferase-like glycosyltransferase